MAREDRPGAAPESPEIDHATLRFDARLPRDTPLPGLPKAHWACRGNGAACHHL